MYFVRSFGPTSAGYEFWDGNPPPDGTYTFTVTDPDGNSGSVAEVFDFDPLETPDTDSITPSLKNPVNEHITATFDNVLVNGVLYDDFDSYSSIDDIDYSKWSTWHPNTSISGGQMVSTLSNSVGRANGGLSFTNPETINSIQADITVGSISTLDGPPRARIRGTFCHNGTGDIGASINVKGNQITWSVAEEYINDQETFEWNDDLASGTLPTSITPGDTVRVSISWDGNKLDFNAQEPISSPTWSFSDSYTVAGPVGPPIYPEKSLQTRINIYTSTTPTFSWNEVTDASRYRLRIYNRDNSVTIYQGYTGEPTYTVPPGHFKDQHLLPLPLRGLGRPRSPECRRCFQDAGRQQ